MVWRTITGTAFGIGTVDDLKAATRTITRKADYADINMSHGHGNFSVAIGAYEKFLTDLNESADEDSIWRPAFSEYNPGITEQWLELLQDGTTFNGLCYDRLQVINAIFIYVSPFMVHWLTPL